MTAPSRLALIATAALAVALSLAGCGNNDPAPAASPSASGSVSAATVAPPTPTMSGEVSTVAPEIAPTVPAAKAEDTAKAYVQIQENLMTVTHATLADAMASFKPVMTEKGYAKRTEGFNPEGSPGAQWQIGHTNNLTVNAVADCKALPEAGITETAQAIRCTITDQTLTDGKPVPVTKLPVGWQYTGPRPSVTLSMVKQGDMWLVDQDITGLVP